MFRLWSRKRAPRKPDRTRRPLLEVLEGRTLLSLFGSTGNLTGTLPGGGDAVAVGDFNADGRPDLAVTDLDNTGVSVFPGDGKGGFGNPTRIAVSERHFSLAVGDFNRDGNQDLVLSGGHNVSVLLGDGKGGFGGPSYFPTGADFARFVAVGDFNGDGNLDLATANEDAAGVSVLLGDGAGNFGSPTLFDPGAYTFSLAVGDFNRDGKQDLAVVEPSGSIDVLLGNGSGGFGSPVQFAVGNSGNSVQLTANPYPQSVAVGDFNGDGNQDLAVADYGSGDVSVLLGDGAGGFRTGGAFPAGTAAAWVVTGDFNADFRGPPNLPK